MAPRIGVFLLLLLLCRDITAGERIGVVDPWEVLAQAETIDVVSLSMTTDTKLSRDFHGYHEFGRVTIRDQEMKAKIIGSLAKWACSRGEAKMCWFPRHAIHAVHGDVTVDMIICFECSQYQVEVTFSDDYLMKANQAKPLLNQILTDAGVELAPESSDESQSKEKQNIESPK